MQNDRIALVSILRKEWESMVGNDGRPIRMYCNNSGGLDNDVTVEVLILKVESIELPGESNVG